MNLRKLARNQACMVRLEGCDGGGETTVLAHYRSVSLGAGTGYKPPDWLGAWACHHCHDLIDGRRRREYGHSHEYYRHAHLEGVLRTLAALEKDGRIQLGE